MCDHCHSTGAHHPGAPRVDVAELGWQDLQSKDVGPGPATLLVGASAVQVVNLCNGELCALLAGECTIQQASHTLNYKYMFTR